MTKTGIPNTTPLTLGGIVLVVLGVLAIAVPAVAGEMVVMVLGIMLLLAGVIQIVSGLRSEGWTRKLPPLILGVITSFCGLGLLGQPWIGMVSITLLLAIFFVVEGIWKIVTAFSYRPASGWLAFFASGIVTLVLGGLIWIQWPSSALWVIGLLVGINMLITGISMLVVATTVRRLKNLVDEAGT